MSYVITLVFNGYDAPCGRRFEPFVTQGGELPKGTTLRKALKGAADVANVYAGHADVTVTEVFPEPMVPVSRLMRLVKVWEQNAKTNDELGDRHPAGSTSQHQSWAYARAERVSILDLEEVIQEAIDQAN